jgi:hypothetical protein
MNGCDAAHDPISCSGEAVCSLQAHTHVIGPLRHLTTSYDADRELTQTGSATARMVPSLVLAQCSTDIALMARVRSLCSFLVVLAFVLGTMVPAAHPGAAQIAPPISAEHSMPADCNQDGGSPTVPMPCGKVFCLGMALLPLTPFAPNSPTAVGYGLAIDEHGAGLSRFPEPDPPRTISVS